MFVLLHRLQRVRRKLAIPAPPRPASLAFRHVDAGSCNGCEHELAGPLESILPVDFDIPGCPPAPQEIADALVGALRLLQPAGRPTYTGP